MSRFQFVADNSDHFADFADRGGVERLCELVEIERSSYYAWRASAPARATRAAADAALVERIRVVPTPTTPSAPRGSPPSSTTKPRPAHGSTTSGWLG